MTRSRLGARRDAPVHGGMPLAGMLLAGVLLAGCVSPQTNGSSTSADNPAAARIDVAQPANKPPVANKPAAAEASAARPPIDPSYRPAQLPNIALTPPLLFELLAAEIALQRQQASSAYNTYQTLAVQTRDARVARRATEIALTGRAFEQALNSARLWLELDAASNEAQQTVETLQLATGRLLDVEPAITRRLAAARAAGQVDDVYQQLQRTLPRIQDRAAGWAMLQRLSAADDAVLSARVARAVVAASADDKEAAARESAAAVKLAPTDAGIVLLAAQQAEALPDGETRAARLLTDYLSRSPDDVMVRLGLGRLHLANRKLAEADETLRAAASRDPQNPQVLFALAQTAYQAQRPADAEQYLKRYVALPESVNRDNAPAWIFLGQISEERQNLPEALGFLERVDGGDLFIGAVSRRAALLARQGRLDEAQKLLQSTTARNARERQSLISAEAQVLREAKRFKPAFEILDKALKDDPGAIDLLYDHAMAAEKVDRIDALESSLRRLMEARPDSAHAYNALGYTLADRNLRLPEALELIEKANALLPNDAHIIDSLGWVHYRMGNFDKSLAYLREAYKLKPDVEVAAHLGEVLWASGRRDEALKVWREASGREPANEVLRGTLARLNVSL